MKKIAKILISVILCLTVAFCSLIPAFATEPKTAFIVVSGMNTFPLYKDGEKVFPTTAKTIAKLASKIILPLVGFFADGDYDKLGDSLFPAAAEAFDDLACNPDGNSKHDITTDLFPLSAGNYPDSFMRSRMRAALSRQASRLSAKTIHISSTTTGDLIPSSTQTS